MCNKGRFRRESKDIINQQLHDPHPPPKHDATKHPMYTYNSCVDINNMYTCIVKSDCSIDAYQSEVGCI